MMMKSSMPRFILSSVFGALFCGASWWAKFAQAQSDATNGISPVTSVWDLVQLGGTGGLIVCLITAVVTLWKERKVLLDMLREERRIHTQVVGTLTIEHKEQVNKITEKLLSEMRKQIDELREESNLKYQAKHG